MLSLEKEFSHLNLETSNMKNKNHMFMPECIDHQFSLHTSILNGIVRILNWIVSMFHVDYHLMKHTYLGTTHMGWLVVGHLPPLQQKQLDSQKCSLASAMCMYQGE